MDLSPTFKPIYTSKHSRTEESPSDQALINNLALQPHPEGGYYKETYRSAQQVPVPWTKNTREENRTRSASSSIIYLLTPGSSIGAFHLNLAQTAHIWHHGRGRYFVIHPDRMRGAKARIETFLVGPDAQHGEQRQWVVEGGKYKASFLLPDRAEEEKKNESSSGLFIREVSFLLFQLAVS